MQGGSVVPTGEFAVWGADIKEKNREKKETHENKGALRTKQEGT